MDLTACLEQLSILEGRNAIEPGWDASQADQGGMDVFLSDATIEAAAGYVGLNSEVLNLLCHFTAEVGRDPALRALWWHGRLTFLGETKAALSKWPMLTVALADRAGLFPALILLSTWEKVKALHEAHHIPPRVVKDTMHDLQLHMATFKDRTGHWGLSFEIAGGWFRRHFTGKIYRLGRLQFLLSRFPAACKVFRNTDGATVALAEDGLAVRQDGYLDGAAGIYDTAHAWTTTCYEDETRYRGHPVDPRLGAVMPEETVLSRQSWKVALQQGDPVYDIHIPESGPLTMELCRESAAQVYPFFARHFPDEPVGKALTCTSWLLDCQLEQILKFSSNICLFLKRFYLTPSPCDPWSIVRAIFGVDIPWNSEGPIDLAALPQESSLQRGILNHLKAGRHCRKSSGFILAEDLPWGKTDYNWKPRVWKE